MPYLPDPSAPRLDSGESESSLPGSQPTPPPPAPGASSPPLASHCLVGPVEPLSAMTSHEPDVKQDGPLSPPLLLLGSQEPATSSSPLSDVNVSLI